MARYAMPIEAVAQVSGLKLQSIRQAGYTGQGKMCKGSPKRADTRLRSYWSDDVSEWLTVFRGMSNHEAADAVERACEGLTPVADDADAIRMLTVRFERLSDQVQRALDGMNLYFASQQSINDVGIESLGFSTRTYNCIKRDGINTVGDLTDRSEYDLMDIRNLGMGSIREIIAALETLGMSLKSEERPDHPGFVYFSGDSA